MGQANTHPKPRTFQPSLIFEQFTAANGFASIRLMAPLFDEIPGFCESSPLKK
jgi:hypothetical protein